jgi:hypothetical protein
MNIPTIAILNQSSLVTDDQVKDVAAALQIQVSRDFAPLWHADASVGFVGKGMEIAAGVWVLLICDTSDQAGALGYHDLTGAGDPLGKVFVADDLRDGMQWSVTASHELLEMLADPWINLAAQDGSQFYAYEVCDACESDSYGYSIVTPDGKSILVSDFVLPDWFQAGTNQPGPFDFRGQVLKPLQLLPDGYISVFQAGVGEGWTQKDGQFSSARVEARSVAQPGSRRYRRRIGKRYWRRSVLGS